MAGYAPDTTTGTGGAWYARAECGGKPTDDWFPGTGNAALTSPAVIRAKGICARCPVRHDCLVAALREERDISDEHSLHGIRGGMTPRERRKYVRDWLQQQAGTSTPPPSAPVVRARPGYLPDMTTEAVAARERRVRELWSRGLTDAQIAPRVGVGSTAVGKIRRRLGLTSNVQREAS